MSNFAPVDLRLHAAAFAIAWLMLAAPSAKAEDPPADAAAPSGTSLSIASWGGAYGQSQEIAYFEPFTKKTGVKITTETYDGTLATIKAKIGGSTSPFDIVDLSAYALDMLCRDGLLETIDSATLAAGPGGQSVSEDFISGGVNSCGIASVAWSTVIAFDRQAFAKAQPSKIADLLDAQRFPGKRALPNGPRYTLELALLADGVEPANLYSELAHACRRRPRLRSARQDQAADPVVVQGRGRDRHVDAAESVDGGGLQRPHFPRRGQCQAAHRRAVGRPDLRPRSLGDPERRRQQGRRQALHCLCHRAGTDGGASRADRLWADAQIGDRARRQASCPSTSR